MQHVVFVGLGFGGLYALRRFVSHGPEDVRITAIDRRDRFVFTPLLYEYLAGELDPDVVAPGHRGLVPEEKVALRRAEAVGIDVGGRVVELDTGERVGYDALVLSPGSVPAYHGVPGAEAHGFPFYSFEDAERLKTALRVRNWAQGTRLAVVVGGGVVGIELACALAELLARAGRRGQDTRVVVLEAMEDILGGMAEGIRRAARARLRELGIDVRTGVAVREVENEGVYLEERGDTTHLEAGVVAWTAGIQPSGLLEGLPAERHEKHGIRVEITLQLPGYPEVFVIGDATSYPGRPQGDPLPDNAQAAVQQSEVCADNLSMLLRGEPPEEEYRYRSLGEFLRVGEGEAIAEVGGTVLAGAPAALARRAAYMVRLPAWSTRLAALRQWLMPDQV